MKIFISLFILCLSPFCQASFAQTEKKIQKLVSGKIPDGYGNAIPKATITVKGTGRGIVSSGDG